MENSVLHHRGVTIISNGGNPLKGCPKDWVEANLWIEKANAPDLGHSIKWSFDCGFKLDFDGGLLTISSRFYPPKTHYGNSWDGKVTIRLGGKIVETKEFDYKTFNQLILAVEFYIKQVTKRVETVFNKEA